MRENRNIDFVRLMNELCVGLGCCGGISDGQPSHVTDFIPAAGPVTAKDFANWALLAEGLDPLVELCQRYRIEIVEDAAESLGSYYKGQHTGNRGRVSALSFNGNKVVTTGGGGAILTNDEELGRYAKHLTTTAKVPHKWLFVHDEIGYNYRLPNINAALGCAQLEQLTGFVGRKRNLAKRYEAAFAGMGGLKFFTEPAFAQSNYWLNVLLLDKANAPQRDALLDATNSLGIMTRPVWNLMHELDIYKSCPRMARLQVAEDLAHRIVNIPSSQALST